MIFKLSNKIYLSGMNIKTAELIKEKLTIQNPAFSEAKKMNRYTGNIEEELKFYREKDKSLICPRGVSSKIYKMCRRYGETIKFVDNRLKLQPVQFHFHGKLRLIQRRAVKSCLSKDFGVLEASTGSGKTIMCLYMIAERKQPALIIVHTKILLYQWIEKIEKFLRISKDKIGIIGDGKFQLGDKITIGTIQSVCERTEKINSYIGYVIIDECHRVVAEQYRNTISQFKSKYQIGLSATPWRRDGLTKLIFWYIGDKTGGINKQSLLTGKYLCPAKVEWIKTSFSPSIDVSANYIQAVNEMVEDIKRNILICSVISQNASEGINLIISDRKTHCLELKQLLKDKYHISSEVLTGDTIKKERERIFKSSQNVECHTFFSTGALIGEGFDLSSITSLYFVTPIKFSGRLIQYLGRALRISNGKKMAFVFDFVDVKNPVFKKAAISRLKTYRKEGVIT